jgi:4-amino-4-deoxy-L-arabinose transferase-like glycosyltransferase
VSFSRRLALIAAGAAALRVIHAVAVAPPIGLFGDGWFFHEVARLVADGDGYLSPESFIFKGIVRPTAEHPPLFAFLLAVVTKLGIGAELAQRALCGTLLGSGTVVLLGLLGRRLGGGRAGLFAALLAAVYPTLIAADGALLSESLYGLLVAAAMLAALRLRDRPTPSRALALGGLCGLAALTRPEALLLLALLAVPVTLATGKDGVRIRVARAGLVILAAAVVVGPWTARNLSTFDRAVLISTNDGTTLAGSNCDVTYSGDRLGSFLTDCIPPVRFKDAGRQDAEWRRAAFDYMGHHSERLPLVVAARLGRTWGLYRVDQQASEVEGRRRWVQTAGLVAYYPLAALAVIGCLAIRRRRLELAVMLAPAAVATVATALTYGGLRFRHAAEISLVVLAGLGVDRLLRRRSQV